MHVLITCAFLFFVFRHVLQKDVSGILLQCLYFVGQMLEMCIVVCTVHMDRTWFHHAICIYVRSMPYCGLHRRPTPPKLYICTITLTPRYPSQPHPDLCPRQHTSTYSTSTHIPDLPGVQITDVHKMLQCKEEPFITLLQHLNTFFQPLLGHLEGKAKINVYTT